MQYGAITTAWYKQREAAEKAGGAKIHFVTFALGDGNGVVPPMPINGLVHQVYTGVISAVEVNPSNAQQLDISIYLPDAVGPFWVREIALFDEQGLQLVAATSNIEKTTAAQGQSSAFKFIISVVMSDAASVQIFNTAPYVTSQELADAISHIPAYTLPTATTTRLGGVKASPSINVDVDGVASVDVPAIENSIFSWISGLFLRLTGGVVTGAVDINARLWQNLGALGLNNGDYTHSQGTTIDTVHTTESFWLRKGSDIVYRIRRGLSGVQQGYIEFEANRLGFGYGSNPVHFLIDATSVQSVHALDLADNSWNVANTDFVQRKCGELNINISTFLNSNYYTKPQSDARYVYKTGDVMSGSLEAVEFHAQNVKVKGVLGTYPQFIWSTNNNTAFIQYLANDGQGLGLNAYDVNGQNGKGVWFVPYSNCAVTFFSSPNVPDCAVGTSNNYVANTRFVTSAVQGRATGSTVLYTAAGAFSGTHPANASFAKIERWGAGGAGFQGGGGSGEQGVGFSGAGGGGGGYCVDIIPITPGSAYYGSVGVGGDPNGLPNGGTTSFAGLVSAFGGLNGFTVINSSLGASGGAGHLYGSDGGAQNPVSGGGGGGSPFGGAGGANNGGHGAFPGGGGGGGGLNGSQGYGANGCVRITY
jgi:Phage tail-collar fibre protein